ncbi:MAG: hypothetical protein Q9157_001396 [Trypethelium eluteriae]
MLITILFPISLLFNRMHARLTSGTSDAFPEGHTSLSSAISEQSSTEALRTSTALSPTHTTTEGLSVSVPSPVPSSYKPKTKIIIVVISGDTYVLPERSIDLPQVDSSSMTLAPSLVVHDGRSFVVPPISEPTSLSSPGANNSITAFPAPNQKPPTGGLTGLPGLMKGLENVASEASKASSALNETMEKGTQWAMTKSMTKASRTLSSIEGSLNEGLSRGTRKHEVNAFRVNGIIEPLLTWSVGLRSVVFAMAGAVSDAGSSFDDLPSTGKGIFEALDQNSSSMVDIFQSIERLISSVPNLEIDTRRHVEGVLKDFFSVAGQRRAQVEPGLYALGLFGLYDWTQMQPSFKLPAAANTTSTLSKGTAQLMGRSENSSSGMTGLTTNTSVDSSRTLNSSTGLKPYTIANKNESSKDEFTSWLKTANLPKRGDHPQMVGNYSVPDLYKTYLTDDEAAKIRNLSFIGYAVAVGGQRRGKRTGVASALPKTSKWKREDVRTQNAHIWRRPDSVYQLDFPNGRQARMRGWPQDPRYFANDQEGHGTKTASVAAGKNIGVASNANIVCVNTASSNGLRDNEHDILEAAFRWIRDDIRSKHLQKRAVILYTESFDLLWGDPAREPTTAVFEKWIPRFKAVYAPFVIAAGNDGQKWWVPGQGAREDPDPVQRIVPMSLDYSIPQRLGPVPGMITVGGTNQYGQLWTDTTPKAPNGHGRIDVYAMADDIEVAKAGTHDTDEDFGTSYAAAATAGVIAYALGIDRLRNSLGNTPDLFFRNLRGKLRNAAASTADISLAFQRVDTNHFLPSNENLQSLPYARYGLPQQLPVVYNQIWNGYCPGPDSPPTKKKRSQRGATSAAGEPIVSSRDIVAKGVSACPAPSASSTSSHSSHSSTPPSSTTSAGPTPSEDCKTKYKVMEDSVTISGTAWDANKLGADGSGLKKAVGKCGAVTKWKWHSPVDGWDFTATFHIGVFMKHCISGKLEEAGSPSNVCHGSS